MNRTPALLMAAATVNIPAISMNVGPMLNGMLTPFFGFSVKLMSRIRW
jgi:dihydroxyacid dehydratase/phosphogluconate dehydratase